MGRTGSPEYLRGPYFASENPVRGYKRPFSVFGALQNEAKVALYTNQLAKLRRAAEPETCDPGTICHASAIRFLLSSEAAKVHLTPLTSAQPVYYVASRRPNVVVDISRP